MSGFNEWYSGADLPVRTNPSHSLRDMREAYEKGREEGRAEAIPAGCVVITRADWVALLDLRDSARHAFATANRLVDSVITARDAAEDAAPVPEKPGAIENEYGQTEQAPAPGVSSSGQDMRAGSRVAPGEPVDAGSSPATPPTPDAFAYWRKSCEMCRTSAADMLCPRHCMNNYDGRFRCHPRCTPVPIPAPTVGCGCPVADAVKCVTEQSRMGRMYLVTPERCPCPCHTPAEGERESPGFGRWLIGERHDAGLPGVTYSRKEMHSAWCAGRDDTPAKDPEPITGSAHRCAWCWKRAGEASGFVGGGHPLVLLCSDCVWMAHDCMGREGVLPDYATKDPDHTPEGDPLRLYLTSFTEYDQTGDDDAFERAEAAWEMLGEEDRCLANMVLGDNCIACGRSRYQHAIGCKLDPEPTREAVISASLVTLRNGLPTYFFDPLLCAILAGDADRAGEEYKLCSEALERWRDECRDGEHPDPTPEGETVGVRIAVVVYSDGYWAAVGDDELGDAEAAERLIGGYELGPGEFRRLSWVTARVPKPSPPVDVTGEVEG